MRRKIRINTKVDNEEYASLIMQSLASRIDLTLSNEVRELIASDPRTEPELLDIMADDLGTMVRYAVSGNRNSSPEALLRVAKSHPSRYVLNISGNNPNNKLAVLWMMDNVDYRYLEYIAHYCEDEEVLRKLLEKESEYKSTIIARMLRNKAITSEIIDDIVSLKYCDKRDISFTIGVRISEHLKLTYNSLISLIDLFDGDVGFIRRVIKRNKLLSKEEKNMLRIKYAII